MTAANERANGHAAAVAVAPATVVEEYAAHHRDAAWEVRRRAFGGPVHPWPGWPGPPDGWRGLVASSHGSLCAFLRVRRLGQYFGGRSVPMGGIASVAVDPHARGTGVARDLLTTAIRAMRDEGQPVSTLFTTVPGLYRSMGWERAGTRGHVTLDLRELRHIDRPSGFVRLFASDSADLDALSRCRTDVVRDIDGSLDHTAVGADPFGPLDGDITTVAKDLEGTVTGYVTVAREPGSDGVLVVRELMAADAETLRVLLRSVGSWAGLVTSVRLPLSGSGSVAAHVPDGRLSVESWYLRVVDLAAAVAARGWPTCGLLRDGVSVDLDVHDEHAPWNQGRYRLVVDGDQLRCERGAGNGAVQLHARALGPWFSGCAGTSELRRAGLLSGDRASALVLDALARVGLEPTMREIF